MSSLATVCAVCRVSCTRSSAIAAWFASALRDLAERRGRDGFGQRAEHADGLAVGAQRQEAPGHRGQGAGADAGFHIVAERPFGGGQGGFVQDRAGGHGGARFQPVFAGDHDDAGSGHCRRLLGRVAQQVAERGGAGEALAEQRDAAQRLDAGGGGFGVAPHLAGQRAGDDADQQEHHQRHQVPRVADRERVDRRQKEKVPQNERGEGGGEADGAAEAAGGGGDHAGENQPHRFLGHNVAAKAETENRDAGQDAAGNGIGLPGFHGGRGGRDPRDRSGGERHEMQRIGGAFARQHLGQAAPG